MKNIKKLYSLLAIATAFSLTGCIEEVEPQSGTATAEQTQESSSAFEASLSGVPSQMAQGYLVYGEQVHETDMGYPQFMIAQTEMLGDMFPEGSNSGYDWYRNYNTFNRDFGENSYFAYLPWYTLYKFVKSANDIIGTSKGASELVDNMAGSAYADRAFQYFMLMVFFEPKENIYTDISSVRGLTVPILTDTTTAAQAANNPRATHEQMVSFILSDCDKAISRLKNYTPSSKTLPNLAVAYGVKAKTYLWDKQYANAALYADSAITAAGGSPMDEDEWTNSNTGFTTATSGWMWYIHYDAENMGNLCNFVGWMSGEADWGYSSLTNPAIDRKLYDHMNKSDFRKNVFLNPDKYNYYNYQTSQDQDFIEGAPDYLSLKFRCKNGDHETYSVGGAIDVPVMRVEEMYFIRALATGETDLSSGIRMLNSFMQRYRDASYSFSTSNLQEFEMEVLAQMRIEFWGEGNAFPVAKMLGGRELVNGVLGVMQNYEGTNAPEDIFKLNARGIKPNWNLVIPIDEVNANRALIGNNNPNPTQTIEGPSPEGQFAPAK